MNPVLQVILKTVVLSFVLLTGFAYLTLLERKVLARLQALRYGLMCYSPRVVRTKNFGKS